jgi:hypothetical protein
MQLPQLSDETRAYLADAEAYINDVEALGIFPWVVIYPDTPIENSTFAYHEGPSEGGNWPSTSLYARIFSRRMDDPDLLARLVAWCCLTGRVCTPDEGSRRTNFVRTDRRYACLLAA